MPHSFNFAASPFDCLNADEQRLVQARAERVQFAAGSVVLVKMPSPPAMPLTSTLVVCCAWNSSTTETTSSAASTVCAGRR